jgi:hypothetical protein
MRFVKVAIGGQVVESSLTPICQIDPGTLWVVMDISQGAMNVPGNYAVSTVKIWGISLQTADQSSNFNGKSIQAFGGMSPGLPLATAQAPQQGLLVQGLILQAFSTFIETQMNIEFLIGPGYNGPATAPGATVAGQSKVASGGQFITPSTPLNIFLVWQPNQNLGDAAAQALRVALPQMTVTAGVSAQLVNTSGQILAHVAPNLASFARWLTDRSVNLMTSSPYGGAPGGYRGTRRRSKATS